MNKVTCWVKQHQVAAFYIIAFAITWGLGFSYSVLLKQNQILLFPLVFLATCGPALAGIIVSAITNTQPRQGSRKVFWLAFLVAWFVSALICLANLKFINQIQLSLAAVGLLIVAVLPVAFVIASAYSRIPAVKSYLSSLTRLRGVLGWSLLGLVLFPALILFSNLINNLVNGKILPSDKFPEISFALIGLILVKFLYQFFFFNGTGEETGWRGFILPRLQNRFCPLIAALIITLFWVPWHFFLWQAEGSPVLTWQFWLERTIGIFLASVILVWIFNRSHGSILAAGITHAAMNTAEAVIPVSNGIIMYIIFLSAVLVIILVDRMWKKLLPDHPAIFRSS